MAIDGRIPDPADEADEGKRAAIERSLAYGADRRHGGQGCRHRHRLHRLLHQQPDRGRRAAAAVAKGRKVADRVTALVVPLGLVKEQAEQEGLDKIFLAAGFEWREPGCPCVGHERR